MGLEARRGRDDVLAIKTWQPGGRIGVGKAVEAFSGACLGKKYKFDNTYKREH